MQFFNSSKDCQVEDKYSSLEWLHKCLQVKNQAKAALPVKSDKSPNVIYRSRSKFRLPFGIRIFHAGNI